MRGIRTSLLGCVFLVAAGSASTAAAQGAPDPVTVRTFMLQRLSQQQAADLLSPYMNSRKGEGVFTTGTGVRGVTVRGTRETLVRVDSLLRANDHPARTIRLRFQLIAASDTLLGRDPAIADVDGALRGLFQFKGYRLLSEGVVFTVEGDPLFSLGLKGAEGERYAVSGELRGVSTGGVGETAELQVGLNRPGVEGAYPRLELLDTRLSAPLGKTVVLGSSAGQGNTTTMILVVRPEAQ